MSAFQSRKQWNSSSTMTGVELGLLIVLFIFVGFLAVVGFGEE